MSELAHFHDAFAEALAGDTAPLAPWIGDLAEADRRLSVYRNTVAKGCADALAAQFPSVARGVGAAWMREAAVRFARAHPPASPSLADYGAGFPDWLAGFEPAAETPWLTELARIDWARVECLFAADAAPIAPAALAGLQPDAYADMTVELHPATRILWFDDGAPTLWAELQGEAAPDVAELGAEPQGILLVRPGLAVSHRILARGGFVFLAACRDCLSLAAAGEAALAAEPGLPLADLFAELISLGAFKGESPEPGFPRIMSLEPQLRARAP